MQSKFNFKSSAETIDVFENFVEIKKVTGKNTTIFIKDITGIEVKHCSFFNAGSITISAASIKEGIIFGGMSGRGKMNENADNLRGFILDLKSKI